MMIDHYAALYAAYQWQVPSRFNIAHLCLHRWTENAGDARRTALCVDSGRTDNGPTHWSWQQLSDTACRLSNGLLKMGVRPGDRVVIAMARPAEFVAAIMAVLGVQAVAVPLSPRLTLPQQRLCIRDSQARLALVDASTGPALLQSSSAGAAGSGSSGASQTGLQQIVGLDFEHEHIIPWRTLLARQSTRFTAMAVHADTPALLCYALEDSSGAGTPPAACAQLFAHSALIGALPGVVCAQDWLVRAAPARPAPLLWSALDWASAAGLLTGLLPSLYLGHAVLATAPPLFQPLLFHPQVDHPALSAPVGPSNHLADTLSRHGVTHLLLDRDALHALQGAANPGTVRAMALHVCPQSVSALPSCPTLWGLAPNALFSLPQICAVIGQSRPNWPAPDGSVGRVYPGHRATVLDDKGLPCPAGITGELVLSRYDIQGHPDPAWSLGAWCGGPSGRRSDVNPATDSGTDTATDTATTRLHTGLSARMNARGDIWLGGQTGHADVDAPKPSGV